LNIYQKIILIKTQGSRLNILLISTIVFFFVWLVALWVQPGRIPSFEAESQGQMPGIFTEKKIPVISTYNVIVDKDIFSSSRRKFTAHADSKSAKRTIPKAPSLILLGTVILDDYRAAMISYKNSKESAKYYQVGNSIEGFVIKNITKDSVLIRRGNETITVEMNQQKKMKIQKGSRRVRALANAKR
jgi:type II secretory pathway component PulC